MGFMLFLAGCLQGPNGNPLTPWIANNQSQPVQVCHQVQTETPYQEEVCKDYSVTKEECALRELNYTSSRVQENDICMSGGKCSGGPLSDCMPGCDQASKRCILEITNNDPQYEGTWVVGATFYYPGASFIKNPQSIDIAPGQKGRFDFTQIYSIGEKQTTASCSLTVIYPGSARDCKQVTTADVRCENVTKTKLVDQEICN